MAFDRVYNVSMVQTQYIDVFVTDALEDAVWEAISLGEVTPTKPITRAEYDEMPIDKRARFLAPIAVACGLDRFLAKSEESLVVYECYDVEDE